MGWREEMERQLSDPDEGRWHDAVVETPGGTVIAFRDREIRVPVEHVDDPAHWIDCVGKVNASPSFGLPPRSILIVEYIAGGARDEIACLIRLPSWEHGIGLTGEVMDLKGIAGGSIFDGLDFDADLPA